MSAQKKRSRRTPEQMIADLEAKIAEVKRRAERKKIARDPALRHVKAAVRSIDKAMAATKDAATRKALEEARSSLSACLSLHGAGMKGSPGAPAARVTAGKAVDAASVLGFLRANPASRSEQIAAALGTDTRTLRPVLKRLKEDGKADSKGQGRATTYSASK